MEIQDYIAEFVDDWRLAGHSPTTAETYARYIRQLPKFTDIPVTLQDVKRWLATSTLSESARARARAVRAFGRWAQQNDGPEWAWWRQVPLAAVRQTPQPTANHDDYVLALQRARTLRDRLVIELLWSTGMRVNELARLTRDDVNLEERFAVVKQSKSGKPRLVPLSDAACRLIRRFTSPSDSVLGMTPHAIQLMLRRIGAPSAHAWRRGWTVNSLRSGVSQTSVQAAGGWASGAMVTRYTAAVSGELAISEFKRRQDPATPGHPAT